VIQIKHLDHLFRIYIKSMGKETVSRVEESLHPKKSAIETINDIFNPMEKVERQIAEFRDELNRKLSAIYGVFTISTNNQCRLGKGSSIFAKWN
jgi:hypothetical protein